MQVTYINLFLFFFPGMRVYLRLEVHLRGRVGGLCGNFDGDTENDFTTRQGIVESTPELIGNSWKVSPSCPDVENQDLRDPCVVSSQTRIYLYIFGHKLLLIIDALKFSVFKLCLFS